MTFNVSERVDFNNPLPVEDKGLGSAQGIITVDIAASDQTLAASCRGVMVTVAGDVAVIMADGSSGVLPALDPGMMYPVAVKTFVKIGTTATGIKALL